MNRTEHAPGRGRLRSIVLGGFCLLAVIACVEAYRAYRFYQDLSESKHSLLVVKNDLNLKALQAPEQLTLNRERLTHTHSRLTSARAFMRLDPLVNIGKVLPVVGKQVKALDDLIAAAEQATVTGLRATDVALTLGLQTDDPNRTAIEEGVTFLRAQEPTMSEVADGAARLQAIRSRIPSSGLWGPLTSAVEQLDAAIGQLDPLVEGYEQANSVLPALLGYEGPRSYLLLPQNNTELFPSGGLISSYGILKFDQGRLVSLDIEYFGTLFDRWQRTSGREYVEPPPPLKNYLLHTVSWALGEAGWYPDFPTTAGLAQTFVQKGGVAPTDGTIAIDLPFIAGLLTIVGPVYVPDYDVTVTQDNLSELSLRLTRDENYVPGESRKVFLSYLSQAVLNRLYSLPKDRWVDLIDLFGRMARERHLQINFKDARLQSLVSDYGFDGALLTPSDADSLLIADTSVNSTKLNLILKPSARVDLQITASGQVKHVVTYWIENPFNEWKIGRDPVLVRALMLQGVYGCYLRIYVPLGSQLADVKLNGQSAGAEQIGPEVGRQTFGRFFTVVPGATSAVQFIYTTDGLVTREANGLHHYQLLVQKEAGTDATPLAVRPLLPDGATLSGVLLDGRHVDDLNINTDLRVDRRIDVYYALP